MVDAPYPTAVVKLKLSESGPEEIPKAVLLFPVELVLNANSPTACIARSCFGIKQRDQLQHSENRLYYCTMLHIRLRYC